MDSPKLCNPLVLAYQGDVVYELLVRRRLIETTRLGVSALHRGNGKAGVCAHYQSQAMEILEPMLTQEELEIYKRGPQRLQPCAPARRCAGVPPGHRI